jgi:hypothetical protein
VIIRYAAFESCPTRWTWRESWVLFSDAWQWIPVDEILIGARPMDELTFWRVFRRVPSLPPQAFRDVH